MRAEDLVAHLGAIVPRPLRIPALVAAWSDQPPMPWVAAIAATVRAAHCDDVVAAWIALESLTVAAASPRLTYQARSGLYAAAAQGDTPISRWFLLTGPPTADAAQLQKQLQPERVLRPRGRPLSLGERKSLARSPRRDVLAWVVRDPHPDVVAIFLENTHVTEADVVRVAATRPAVPASLAAIATHSRWGCRQAVKRALVWNPAMPIPHGVRVTATLRTSSVRELADGAAEGLPVYAAEFLRWL